MTDRDPIVPADVALADLNIRIAGEVGDLPPPVFHKPAETAGVPVATGIVWAWQGSRLMNLADPRGADVDPEDVALNLSRTMRYNGGTLFPWSVLDHLLTCDRIADAYERAGRSLSLTERRAILIHDAAEWIVGDNSRPVKIMVPEVRAFEAEVWRKAVAPRFCVPADLDELPIVKEIDNMAAAAEGLDLFAEPQVWPGLPVPLPEARIGGFSRALRRLGIDSPALARRRFLARCEALDLR